MKSTRRFLIIVAVLLGLAVASVGIVYAITNGEPDGNAHPYVGLVVFYDAGGVPMWRCSGALLSPTVFLTAGHCTSDPFTPPASAQVWFDEGPIPSGNYPGGGASCSTYTGYPCTGDAEGTPYTNPDYGTGSPGRGLPAFDYRDVGVVVLDEPVEMAEYAQLPTAGYVDTLKNKTDIDLVGYGVQWLPRGGGPPWGRWAGPKMRLFAPSQLISGKFVHSDEFIRISMNPGGGTGGSCFGDSGGPDLEGGTNTVLAVNSYVTNYQCAGVGYSSRVDIQEVLDWINSF